MLPVKSARISLPPKFSCSWIPFLFLRPCFECRMEQINENITPECRKKPQRSAGYRYADDKLYDSVDPIVVPCPYSTPAACFQTLIKAVKMPPPY